MVIQLNVSDELEARLRQRATDLGVTVKGLATDILSAGIAKQVAPSKGSELESWRAQGLIGYRNDITDSAKHARALRKSTESRPR